jgi:hypothetical protein
MISLVRFAQRCRLDVGPSQWMVGMFGWISLPGFIVTS